MVVDRSAGVKVHVSNHRGRPLARQVYAGAIVETAGLVQNHAAFVQAAGSQRHGMAQALELLPVYLVKYLPHHNAGVIAVAQHHFAKILLNACRHGRRKLRPEPHALHRDGANHEHPHPVSQFVDDGGLGLAPRAKQVKARLLGQTNFLFNKLRLFGKGQCAGIVALVERSLDQQLFAVQVKIPAARGEFPHAKDKALFVLRLSLGQQFKPYPVEMWRIRRPQAG